MQVGRLERKSEEQQWDGRWINLLGRGVSVVKVYFICRLRFSHINLGEIFRKKRLFCKNCGVNLSSE